MKLYDFFSSSCAFRVRIVLNLKGISYERMNVKIPEGEQFLPAYMGLNPTAAVPSLVDENGGFIQSLAISEYLNELYPDPPLLPTVPAERARVRAIAQSIACDIQPLHPARVTKFLAHELGVSDEGIQRWCVHWISIGIRAVETVLASQTRRDAYCHGDRPTLADVALVPQIYVGVNRFKIDVPTICPIAWGIYQNCMARSEFSDAAPDKLPDAIR